MTSHWMTMEFWILLAYEPELEVVLLNEDE